MACLRADLASCPALRCLPACIDVIAFCLLCSVFSVVTDPYATTYGSTYQPLSNATNVESTQRFQKKPMLAKTIDAAYHSLQLRKNG